MVYFMFCFIINKVCVCFATNSNARKVGRFVFYSHFGKAMWMATLKLYLESYFDLVICSFLNLYAFGSNGGIAQFWTTRDDRYCSVMTIIYSIFTITFPAIVLKYTWDINVSSPGEMSCL